MVFPSALTLRVEDHFSRRNENGRYHQKGSSEIYKTEGTFLKHALCTTTGLLIFSRGSSSNKRIILKRNSPKFEVCLEIEPFSNKLGKTDIGSGNFANCRILNVTLEGASTYQNLSFSKPECGTDTTSESGDKEHVGERSHAKRLSFYKGLYEQLISCR